VLKAADVVLLTLSLNKATRGLIDARAWREEDAILVNARGPLIDQARSTHILANRVSACRMPDGRAVRAWHFSLHPFFELPNFLGSPQLGGGAVFSPRHCATPRSAPDGF
jgi:phosphoglycerate dehydrogenase-like enzyme